MVLANRKKHFILSLSSPLAYKFLHRSHLTPPARRFSQFLQMKTPTNTELLYKHSRAFTIYSSVTWYQLSYFFYMSEHWVRQTFCFFCARLQIHFVERRRKTKIYIDWYTSAGGFLSRKLRGVRKKWGFLKFLFSFNKQAREEKLCKEKLVLFHVTLLKSEIFLELFFASLSVEGRREKFKARAQLLPCNEGEFTNNVTLLHCCVIRNRHQCAQCNMTLSHMKV